MKIYDIDNINKVDGIYDLTQLTFRYNTDQGFREYVVQRGEEMRIDLVCKSIYNNTNYIDLICNINNIDNPLNIKVDQVILYPIANFEIYRYSEKNNEEDLVKLSNPNKSTRKDESRKNYVEKNQSLPPTILSKKVNQLNVDTENIILGQGLF